MKLSVVIPAFNEESELPHCLQSIHKVFDTILAEQDDLEWELIVTDNNSTDGTGEIARTAGAMVVFEPKNQIARARNAGAAVATGDWLLFIDADSRLHVESIREMLANIYTGRCGGGGCLVRMEEAPRWGQVGIWVWNTLSSTMNWAAGSFIFCRMDGFREVGGFDEQYYAAEELYFSSVIKKWCRQHQLRFKILKRQRHASSARKFHIYSTAEILRLLRSVFFSFHRTVRGRNALDFFYDGRR